MRTLAFAAAIAALLASASWAASAEYTVIVSDMAFGPLPEQLRVGDTLVWRNDDIFAHTATARDGGFDVDLPAKTSASMVVGSAGSFAFFCKFHPGMTGTLAVAP